MAARSMVRSAPAPDLAAGSLHLLRQMVVAGEVAETRDLGIELQVDRAGWSVALLADDDLGLAVGRIHLDLPLDVLVGARPRLLVAQVVFLAVHEQDDVGVLLD